MCGDVNFSEHVVGRCCVVYSANGKPRANIVIVMGEPEKKNVCVVVLGDIGRSPRMQYHAQSLIREGYNVDIVGYTDSPVLDDLRERATIIAVKKPFPFDECECFP